MKKKPLELALVAGLGLFILNTLQVAAQPLIKDAPTGNLT